MEVARSRLTEALLISSYDLQHSRLPAIDELLGGKHHESIYSGPKLLLIDSGGYELDEAWSPDDLIRENWSPKPFTATDHEKVVDCLPDDLDIMVVSFDHMANSEKRTDYRCQVEAATRFFEGRPRMMSDFLIRPPGRNRYVDASEIGSLGDALGHFDAIGLTEKEAGDSVFSRLVTIAALRQHLDSAGVDAPIHVFGVLDPLLVTLYFVAGAELFDGLTWLRFGVHAGISVYAESWAVLANSEHMSTELRGAMAQLGFLDHLRQLKRQLVSFVESEGDEGCFEHGAEEVARIRWQLREELNGGI